ncbi:hypothetical protein EHI44_11415 [Rhizobium leguminosarum]|uniref:7-cyano-7-deazaguanine synthase n=1 Tax=Rhizobium leguminosarum TaxID=384 RepID=UPI000FF37316|nr:7-cyano-7-deazaguanine synthase [Rhizobium leguminosarum]RWY88651.1 hypothetical protein EHI44_11415 [Rhizobium leguminosarum]
MPYILLSGGLDSTVLAAYLFPKIPSLKAIYVNHGQLGAIKEISSADNICSILGINLKVIDIAGCWPSFSDVAAGRPSPTTSSAIALNAGLVLAMNYVAWAGERDIYVGIHKDDLIGRPWLIDMFDKYIEASQLIQPSTTGVPPGGNEYAGLTLHFPFKDMTKGDIIKTGLSLGVDLMKTQSCQYSSQGACGKCYICDMRREGFVAAGVPENTFFAP